MDMIFKESLSINFNELDKKQFSSAVRLFHTV